MILEIPSKTVEFTVLIHVDQNDLPENANIEKYISHLREIKKLENGLAEELRRLGVNLDQISSLPLTRSRRLRDMLKQMDNQRDLMRGLIPGLSEIEGQMRVALNEPTTY